ncbi:MULTISPECIES: beta-ketoacyl-[acyl-carrier-protein] synthase family protein [Paenibacillus]|uniref:beta-ketoacyl-[acyl-carrier-protein] synthase family protein n=1 Tax=Paenibacillus TaxID=44249 RepID=UPI00203E8BE5|nr:beta-ketoacyl-[acyl-carrier-protein] synthase family protein [Paenibacillus camelliae]MCM3634984.1 beta-ketoacyl-[acyl-carrier-protein] synthase family protein [Paenibacillus camelliae]
MRRVVVTGLGLISPLGSSNEEVWHSILRGDSAVQKLSHLRADKFNTQYGYPIISYNPKAYIKSVKKLRMMSRGDSMCYSASMLAMEDAGLPKGFVSGQRFGLYVGGSKEVDTPPEDMVEAIMEPSVETISDFVMKVRDHVHPLFFVKGLPASSMFYISEELDLRGPNCYYMGTANASAVAIGNAARAVAMGEADAALAGGFSDPLTWWNYLKVDGMGVLNREEGEDRRYYRPFDRQRKGALLGEGSTMLVVEELEHALARGAKVYGEIVGYGNGMDCDNIVKPSDEGIGLQTAMKKALRHSNLSPAEIKYVCAHGSGTKSGDESEARAIASIFAAQTTAVSSIKPTVGHQFSNAGAFNAYASLMAIQSGVLPHTLHLSQADPSWKVDFIAEQPREVSVTAVMSLARGLNGENTALIFKALA